MVLLGCKDTTALNCAPNQVQPSWHPDEAEEHDCLCGQHNKVYGTLAEVLYIKQVSRRAQQGHEELGYQALGLVKCHLLLRDHGQVVVKQDGDPRCWCLP
jgi:hypothetical protein